MIGALAHSPASDPNPPGQPQLQLLSVEAGRGDAPRGGQASPFLASARIVDNPRRSLRPLRTSGATRMLPATASKSLGV